MKTARVALGARGGLRAAPGSGISINASPDVERTEVDACPVSDSNRAVPNSLAGPSTPANGIATCREHALRLTPGNRTRLWMDSRLLYR